MTSDPLSPLPADAVLVHIGPHKTGTTAIQSTLAGMRPTLRSADIYYPGRYSAHHRQAESLRQYRQGGNHGAGPPLDPSVWARLARRVREAPGRVVVSSEFFAQSDADARAQLVRDLDPERVYLVAGARNPAGIAVSTWQQDVRTYGTAVTLPEWLDENFRQDDSHQPVTDFWSHADPGALIERWLDAVPAERITVVVVDERDRRRLPTAFEQLLGLPPGLLADAKVPSENRGLSALETAFVRDIAVALESKLTWEEYRRMMRAGVIRRLQEVRRPGPDEPKASLPDWAREQAVTVAERSIATLDRSGVRIFGDIRTLTDVPAPGPELGPVHQVPIELATQAVVGAIAAATRDDWSLDSPRPAPPKRSGAAKRPAAAQRPPAGPAEPAAGLDAVPARELLAALARNLAAAVRRRPR